MAQKQSGQFGLVTQALWILIWGGGGGNKDFHFAWTRQATRVPQSIRCNIFSCHLSPLEFRIRTKCTHTRTHMTGCMNTHDAASLVSVRSDTPPSVKVASTVNKLLPRLSRKTRWSGNFMKLRGLWVSCCYQGTRNRLQNGPLKLRTVFMNWMVSWNARGHFPESFA